MIAKEPGNKTWGGGAIRPGRSARPRVSLKHGGPTSSKDHRPAANTVSCWSNVRVVGVVTSGKWLVNLTGEVPLRPRPVRAGFGKPMYKSTTKAAATRQDRKRRLISSQRFLRQPRDEPQGSSGTTAIRSSGGAARHLWLSITLPRKEIPDSVHPNVIGRSSQLAAVSKRHRMMSPCSAVPGHRHGMKEAIVMATIKAKKQGQAADAVRVAVNIT